MRIALIALAISFSFSVNAKEWKSLKQYQNATQETALSPSDWLSSDRRQNTLVWQLANVYNINQKKPQEYQTIKERRDFYEWIDHEFKAKGHEVIWLKMAYYITCKLRLLETFPHCLITTKPVKRYAHQGSEEVFNHSFENLKILLNSDKILKDNDALEWDKMMLHDEQYIWVESVYRIIDKKSLKQIKRMARGKFLYSFAVPKAIRFEGDISIPYERYNYALRILRPYCKNHLE
jgi:hypothetical protein